MPADLQQCLAAVLLYLYRQRCLQISVMFRQRDRHLYLHIPYCAHKCPYCDFNSIADRDAEQDDYVTALLQDMQALRGRRYRTLFIGGGTPTHLRVDLLERLLQGIRELILLTDDYEWTCEANPGSSDTSKLELLQRYGVNRLSVGVQSTHAQHLHTLERQHDVQQAHDAISAARILFPRVSCDLIFGLLGQTDRELQQDMDFIEEHGLQHASLYHLTIESGTAFHARQQRGQLTEIDEERSWQMFQLVSKRLQALGLRAYETSNYASPGHECLHNLAYWEQRDYDAAGAGAVSTINGLRQTRLKHPGQYIAAVQDGRPPVWKTEQLSLNDLITEAWMLGLRLHSGVRIQHLQQLGDPETRWRPLLQPLLDGGLVEETQDCIALSSSGRPLQDHITAQLMP